MTSNIRMRDLARGERPRERLIAKGPDALSTEEHLAILLRTGTRGMSALDAARQLLSRFGTLDRLSRGSIEEIQAVRGIGRAKALGLLSALTLARRLAAEVQGEAPLLDTPERVADLLREENRAYTVEQFQVLLLNSRQRLIRREKISQGTLDTILVHPREVYRAAILANAAAVILVHNHPSGDPTPSSADIKATRDLVRAGQLLQIELVDHIILGRRSDQQPRDWVSLRELGHLA